MQHIGEGRLDIPHEWHNRSVNIYTAQGSGAGLSVTINRETLPFHTPLDDYVAQQSRKLGKQLAAFKLIEQETVEVDGRPAHRLEFTWRADDAGPIHQLLLCVANGPVALSLAASFGGTMSEAQAAEAWRILLSLRFEDAATADDPASDPANALPPDAAPAAPATPTKPAQR